MRSHVLLQKHFPGESFGTQIAFVWFYPRMYPFMHVQRHSLIERFRAKGAFVFLFVSDGNIFLYFVYFFKFS